MAMDSVLFVYLFLPASILLFAVLPAKTRPAYLVVVSGGFYYLLEGNNLYLMLGVVLFDYLMVWLLQRSSGFARLRRSIVFCSVAKSVGLYILYSANGQHFPLGLGVYALTSMGYVLDCYRHFAVFDRNPVPFFLMNTFFPKLYAGPLVHYGRLGMQLRSLKFSWAQVAEGGGLFLCGLAKKLLLGDQIRKLLMTLLRIPLYEVTTLTVWVMVATLSLTLYFLLSGYCDMARGLGLVFGFELPENFFNPCRAKGVNEFLARFNATVSRYMRRNVYIGLGGAQGSVLSASFNILLVSILMGLWFGMRLNFLAWGASMAFFVLVEKYLLPRGWNNVAPLFRWLYCMTSVSISFVFFLGQSVGQSVWYLQVMLGLKGTGGLNSGILYLLASNYMVLLLAVVIATGLPRDAARLIRGKLPVLYELACAAGSVLLLVGVTAFMV